MHPSMTLLAILPPLVRASIGNPHLLPTPPMGFNNWARFMCNLNESLFLDTAAAMLDTGLHAAGYTRLNLDDCWMASHRAPNGSLPWDPTKFPHSLPWLSAQLRSLGFSLGIYQDAGNVTCGGYPGSYGFEELDAHTFAEWGVDYLKLDGCNVSPAGAVSLADEYRARYARWHSVLGAMPHPLVFSESAPAYFVDPQNATAWYGVMDWVPAYGELARHSTDILVYEGEGSAWQSIMVNYRYNTLLARYQRPGYFNDPDFLIADHPGLSLVEKRSHFALWASFGAPLIISADVPGLSKEVIAVLTNADLIRVDQDALGLQATLASRSEHLDVLTRSLDGGDRLVTILNRGDGGLAVKVPVGWMGLQRCAYQAKNLWDGEIQEIEEDIEVQLDSHATEVFRVSLPPDCPMVIPTGIVFNTASGNCLTDGEALAFEPCRGQDLQVWQVEESGILRPLSRTSHCLTAIGDNVVVKPCTGRPGQRWTYHITGNLQNQHTGACLTEGTGIDVCGFELDSQVFGLPSGVDIEA
ncbi:putative alpha-galactosidase [Aspergillus clavatus NRRL 1]|uniref:Probable alpha-galactosidase A n=1 Tax=Aspergillus clavatus (strain ATCC 1007 / CBS 513.65 / DSM 816 / NCTC 3887 / NRRL 1 / QM 1276 / 107) TaxID=344612 RepID=AGALA_ASPCL|nr:alpha-galactosidase, putative [Aspergillus clavatus NRRL 1]A1CBW8.1 RecName: Full=Probable alpha-galactosidase A; AltName: Full=Melibiase A; Flags: Precursor [Aspergillus clavatus NRRL 1]EAW13236.1 alpha-galactosidase, putative [Aspergillus clavatus NRRL 1]